jgi:hypothetical protein
MGCRACQQMLGWSLYPSQVAKRRRNWGFCPPCLKALLYRAPAWAAGQSPACTRGLPTPSSRGRASFKPPQYAVALQNTSPARTLERATPEEAQSSSKSCLQAFRLQALRVCACP